MIAPLHIILRFWLGLALSIGIATAGMAHRAPMVPADSALSEYLAAGGLLSDICGGGGSDHSAPIGKCDACRLMVGIVPIAATGTERPTGQSFSLLTEISDALDEISQTRTAHQPRAPPVI